MIKKISVILIVFLLIFTFVGCSISRDEFIKSIKSYPISVDEKTKTVDDFINQMEELGEENEKITTFVDASWSEEKISEESDFIQRLKQKKNFVYDDRKYYGELRINVTICSTLDYKTIEDYTYVYLFSLDDNNNVTAEASANYLGNSFDYKELHTEEVQIRDSMSACLILTKTAKSMLSN